MAYRAGKCTYNGNVCDMAGKLYGPTTYGSYLFARAAEYDPVRDKTVVTFEFHEPDQDE